VDSQAFAVGTEVEARYKGRHEWFRAMIVASHRNNTSFDLRYNHELKITMSSHNMRFEANYGAMNSMMLYSLLANWLIFYFFIEAIRTSY